MIRIRLTGVHMSEKKGTVIKQAAFLMVATLICRVIGLLYRSPLHAIMGDIGDGYYSFAFEWYNIILLLATYSIPMAVSKVMAGQLALKQYKNAQKVFHSAFIYAVIVGGVGALIAYFGAPYLLSTQPDAVLALQVLAPTIFLSGILGVMRGYFQAQNTMMPTGLSQMAEQIVNAVISVVAAWAFTRAVVGNENLTGKYGAAGGTLGTGAGVLIGLIFMCLVYGLNKKTIQHRMDHDTDDSLISTKDSFKMIFMMVTPVILATCVYNSISVIDQLIFTRLMPMKGFSETDISAQYSIYGYKFRPIINIPIALASATSTALIPSIATSIASRKPEDAAKKIDESVRLTMFLAIPSAVGICILSLPIIRILYPGGNVQAAAVILSLGSVSIIFYCLSTVTNGVLQGLGKPSIPVINSLISLGVNVAVCAAGIWFLDMGVTAVLMANVLYAMTVSFLNSISVKKYLPYKNEIKSSYLLPLLASLGMGVVIGVLYWVPAKIFSGIFDRYIVNALWTVVVVLVGIVIYIVLYAVISGKSEEELKKLPAGVRIVKLLHMLHIHVRG